MEGFTQVSDGTRGTWWSTAAVRRTPAAPAPAGMPVPAPEDAWTAAAPADRRTASLPADPATARMPTAAPASARMPVPAPEDA